ncbi:MAG TPA: Fic family protein [Microbacteriaceae bacterium]
MASRSAWPAIGHEKLEWTPIARAWATREEAELAGRTLTYSAAIPSAIATQNYVPGSDLTSFAEEAVLAVTRFDSTVGREIAPFSSILLRSEAAASSRIENLTASARAILSAEAGDTSKRNATQIAANTASMRAALSLASHLNADAILAMHAALMEGDERHNPGQWRNEPVWIGTGGVSPIGAEFVAPNHVRVPALIDDLVRYIARNDVPVIIQAAIAHAQFETIHAFTDGNGRTGRSLLQAMLRAKGVTRLVTIPVSAGLLTDTEGYHRALTSYRAGSPDEIIRLVAGSCLTAINNADLLVADIDNARSRWRNVVKARKDSALWHVIDVASRQPVLSATIVAEELAISPTNVYRYLDQLVRAGVLRAFSVHRQGRFWRADEILQALDAFAARAGRRDRG